MAISPLLVFFTLLLTTLTGMVRYLRIASLSSSNNSTLINSTDFNSSYDDSETFSIDTTTAWSESDHPLDLSASDWIKHEDSVEDGPSVVDTPLRSREPLSMTKTLGENAPLESTGHFWVNAPPRLIKPPRENENLRRNGPLNINEPLISSEPVGSMEPLRLYDNAGAITYSARKQIALPNQSSDLINRSTAEESEEEKPYLNECLNSSDCNKESDPGDYYDSKGPETAQWPEPTVVSYGNDFKPSKPAWQEPVSNMGARGFVESIDHEGNEEPTHVNPGMFVEPEDTFAPYPPTTYETDPDVYQPAVNSQDDENAVSILRDEETPAPQKPTVDYHSLPIPPIGLRGSRFGYQYYTNSSERNGCLGKMAHIVLSALFVWMLVV